MVFAQEIDQDRRSLLCTAAMSLAGARFGIAAQAHASGGTGRGTGRGMAATRNSSFDVIKQIDAGLLNVGYVVPASGLLSSEISDG